MCGSQEEDDHQLDSDPTAVNRVEFPLRVKSLQANWIDVSEKLVSKA